MDIHDVFALLSYWVTWPPNHKLRAAQAGYKAPRRRVRPTFRKGQDLRTEAEQMIEANKSVIPFAILPTYIKEALLAHGNDPTNRN